MLHFKQLVIADVKRTDQITKADDEFNWVNSRVFLAYIQQSLVDYREGMH